VVRAGAGATHVQTVFSVDRSAFMDVSPSGYGTVRLDLARTWSLAGDYRRAVTVLEGVALHPFASDTGAVTVGGRLDTSVLMTLSGAYSTGASQGTDFGSFASIVGAAQLQYELTTCCALITSYNYYYYRLRDIAAIPAGLPRRYERNSIRIGLSMMLPLYGTLTASR
jgi:hypothetical protein